MRFDGPLRMAGPRSPLAPACCFAERLRDWVRFQLHLGLTIVEVTGDMDAPSYKLATANIIMSVSQHGLNTERRGCVDCPLDNVSDVSLSQLPCALLGCAAHDL